MLKKIKTKIIGAVIVVASLFLIASDNDNFEVVKNLDIYYTLFRELNMFYVDQTDPGKLVKTSIDGMLKSLDPYTVYYPESEIEDYSFMTTGQYGGVGALIHRNNDEIVISEPYVGYPAQKSGIKAGDVLLEVDGKSANSKSIDDISKYLKGQPGSTVNLKLRKALTGQIVEMNIGREKITIASVPYFGMLNNEIGYIRLSEFTEKATDEVKKALVELKDKRHAKSIVFDLRGNPGGLLMEAVGIVNLFVNKGVTVVSTKGKVSQWNKTYYANESPVDNQIPVVVLVNRNSASASEIVSGSLQDLDRAVIVGQRTYGKGLVQTTRDLTYNTKLKVTTAKYYIPSGRCIQALDYTHRNDDGSVGKVPDSLITAFKTSHGRKVFDGGGILPDVTLKPQIYSRISYSLLSKYFIFDYATKYAGAHDSIVASNKFHITDNDYNDFMKFISGKKFDYETRSEDELDKLVKMATTEKYFASAEGEFNALRQKLAHDKEKDLSIFKEEIKEMLDEEIVSRYYFQNGKIEASFVNDNEVKKAIEILKNPSMYSDILLGKYKAPIEKDDSEDDED